MKYFTLLTFLFIASCTHTKLIPLKGNYPSTPMVFSSEKSFDKTWDNLIDVFAQKGLSIRIIDRSSGLIISQTSLLKTTIEGKAGLVDSTAFIAVPYYLSNKRRIPITNPVVGAYAQEKDILPTPVYGDWNVRIKASPTGGSIINVNITDLNYKLVGSKIKDMQNNIIKIIDYKSTGVFEKQLADLIK